MFGLSEYASRVYLALLDLGLTEARPASALSKVPTSKIYKVLDQLHEKGLVEITPEYPKRYAPVPFTTFLDKLHRTHAEAARDIARRRDALAAQFSVRGDVAMSEPGSITAIRGRHNTFEKIEEMLRDASDDALLLTSDTFYLRTSAGIDRLRAATTRGCRLRILTPLSDSDPAGSLSTLSRFAEIRACAAFDRLEIDRVAILITDRKRALTIDFAPESPHRADGDDTAIYIDQPAIVATLQSLIEFQWVRAPAYESGSPAVSDGTSPRAPHEPRAMHDASAPARR